MFGILSLGVGNVKASELARFPDSSSGTKPLEEISSARSDFGSSIVYNPRPTPRNEVVKQE